jgi:effector-binding domain-containing protein
MIPPARARGSASRPYGSAPTYAIVERTLQPVASIRVQVKPDEISATLAVLLPEVMAHITATGAKMAGAPFSRYHTFGADSIDLEAGIPVASAITPSGRVQASELPAGKAVTAWHIGPYDQLAKAHAALKAHLESKQLRARGGPWEVYWTDPGMVRDPAKWRTQLFQPIEE